MVRQIHVLVYCFTCFLPVGCKDNPNPNSFIPDGPVSLVINTDLPEYYKLKTPGTYVYQPGGNRGVLLVHNFDGNFVALERTCSYEPDRSCSRIFVDSLNMALRCGSFNQNKWEPCCDSRFLMGGEVSQGPAVYNLKTYSVQVNGAVLTVRN